MTQPIKVEVEIDLNDYLAVYTGYDPDTGPEGEQVRLEGVILRMAATQLLEQLEREGLRGLRSRVTDIREEEIREQVRPMVAEAIESSINPTNSLGEPIGEPTTLRQVILDEAQRIITKPSGSRSRNMVEEVIESTVTRQLDKELRAAANEAKAQVEVAIREKGAEFLAEVVAKLATP